MASEEAGDVRYTVKSGEVHSLVHPVPILHVRLGIDPSDAASKDDKFKLTSTDGSYEKTLTVKDDKIDGDEFVDLVYDNLKTKLSYTLEVDPGAEGSPYKLFENVSYRDLVDYYSMPGEGEDLEDEEPEDGTGTPADGGDWEDDGSSGEHGGDFDDDDDAMNEIFEEEEAEPSDDDEIDWDSFDPSSMKMDDDDAEDDDW